MGLLIGEGDDVLLYLDNRRTYLVRAFDREFHTHKGVINLGELIGKEYGSRIKSSRGVEFVALKPSIKDYIFKMRRGTQIIYPKDLGLILVYTSVGPGSRVVEAGTGTGALTSILAYHVKPSGKVYSYEIRTEFLEIASRNLERVGVHKYVELKNKDITEGIDESEVDAVILDMATPWLVVSHAYLALRGSGIFASFSPTIDQTVKTVKALQEQGFVYIETVECMLRGIRVEEGKTRPETLMTAHTGYLTFARKSFVK